MSRAHWSPDDRAEYEALLERSFTAGSSSHERIDAYEALLADAVQAHRPWARDVERENQRQGANREVTAYGKRREPKVRLAYNGRVISKPARRGVRNRASDGTVVHQQVLWVEMNWDELDRFLTDNVRQSTAVGDNVRIARRLMALNEAHPHTSTVGQALALEGKTLDEWLEASA